jgi:hypothetical protein
MYRLRLPPVFFFCFAIAGCAFAAPDAGSVKLKESPPLLKDTDALPRLLSGAKPAIIDTNNAILARLDAQELQAARDCLSEPGGDYNRSVSATMQGPRFLSLVATNSFFCAGAAHPDSETQTLVFDLATGRPVNWERLLPGKVHVKKFDADIEAQDSFGRIVSSDAIWTLYKKAALGENHDQDCVEVFNEAKLDFSLYLDAKENAVAAREVGLRHARQACGTTLYLSGSTLKSLGASKELIDALNAAHSGPSPARR